MPRFSKHSILLGAAVLAALALPVRPALAESKATMSIKIETDEGKKIELESGGDWLQGLIAGADITCEADDDRDTRQMMASLTRQGERGVYRGRDDDGDYLARRRDGMLRIEQDADDGERTLVEMPWEVAQCLMSGIDPEGDLGARLASGKAKLRFETAGESGARVSIRIE